MLVHTVFQLCKSSIALSKNWQQRRRSVSAADRAGDRMKHQVTCDDSHLSLFTSSLLNNFSLYFQELAIRRESE